MALLFFFFFFFFFFSEVGGYKFSVFMKSHQDHKVCLVNVFPKIDQEEK